MRQTSNLFAPDFIRRKKTIVRWHFAPGDIVRITKARHTPFDKGYKQQWTRELFRVKTRIPTDPPTYGLKDMQNESIKGKFYHFELQKVDVARDQHFAIDKILKTKRGADGKISYYVSWLGYPSKFNSWVHDVVRVGG